MPAVDTHGELGFERPMPGISRHGEEVLRLSPGAETLENLRRAHEHAKTARNMFEIIRQHPGDVGENVADFVDDTYQDALRKGTPEAHAKAVIADEVAIEGMEEDERNVAVLAAEFEQQRAGTVEEVLREVAIVKGNDMVKEVIKAIDEAAENRHTLHQPPSAVAKGSLDQYGSPGMHRTEGSILAQLQPGLAKDDKFVKFAEHAIRHGEKLALSDNGRVVDLYLSRLEELSGKVGVERLFKRAQEGLVIKKEQVPEQYFLAQEGILRDNGQGGFDLKDAQFRKEEIEDIQTAQRSGLESWATLLQADKYPTWFKVYAWDGMSKLSTFNYGKGTYNKRSSGTTAPYPKTNSEALDSVFQQINLQIGEGMTLDDAMLTQLIKGGNFNKIYSHALMEVKAMVPTPEDPDQARNGTWIEYASNEIDAVMSASEGTPWCIAGEEAATKYLSKPKAKFYMYHMKDKADGRVSPTACVSVRIENDNVAEISGIAGGNRQLLEPGVVSLALEKVKDLPGGERFLQAYSDREMLKTMDKKMQSGEDFTLEELATLYEIDRKIQYTIADEKQVNDPRPTEFKANKAKHVEQLRELYGEDAEWLTKDTLSTADQVTELLDTGADANRLFHKLEIGPTWHPQSKLQEASFEVQRGEILRAYTYNFDTFVKKGLTKETVQRVFDASRMINLPSMARGMLEAGIDAEDTFAKVLPSLNHEGIVFGCIEDFAKRGVNPDTIAQALINEWGSMATVTEYKGGSADPFAFDYEVVVQNPIQRLDAIGAKMTHFAEHLSRTDLATHREELSRHGVAVEEILAEKERNQEAPDPAFKSSVLTNGWVQPDR